LRRNRTEQSRTLRDVARDARVSLGYLSEVERGQKEASSELLNALCVALGINLSTLMAEVTHEISSLESAKLTVVDAA
jgi:transcriptional regulator with XRE-family HTH domain